MIGKYVIMQLKKYKLATILLVLQITLMFIVSIAITSSILSRYQEYAPFREAFNTIGNYYSFMFGKNPETNLGSLSTEQLSSQLKGNPEVWGTYAANFALKRFKPLDDPDASDYRRNWTISNTECVAYDDEWIEAYSPKLEEGNWLSTSPDVEQGLPVVISHNPYGYKVGSRFPVMLSGRYECEAVVIGVLEEGAKYLSLTYPQGNDMSAHNLYQSFFYQIEEKMLVLISEQAYEKLARPGMPNGQFLILYPNGISDEDRAWNDDYMKRVAKMMQRASTTERLRYNSLEYIYSEVKKLIPIIVAIFVMVITSVVSMTAIMTKRQLYTYAIYNICGLSWNKSIVMSFLYAVSVSIFALICTGGIWFICRPLLKETVIHMSMWHFPVILGIIIVFLVASMILPITILSNHTPKEILCEN